MPAKKGPSKQLYSDTLLEKIAKYFAALGDAKRLKIISSLTETARTVSELHLLVGGSLPNVSKHLSILRAAGIVRRMRDGGHYSQTLADSFSQELMNQVLQLLRDQQLARVRAMK